jgi:hypothetical protein
LALASSTPPKVACGAIDDDPVQFQSSDPRRKAGLCRLAAHPTKPALGGDFFNHRILQKISIRIEQNYKTLPERDRSSFFLLVAIPRVNQVQQWQRN